MKLKTLIIAIALGFALPAAADFVTKARAHEVTLSTVRMPQSTSGTIGFKPCASCDYRTARVTPATRWQVNNRAMTLEKFKQALDAVEDRSDTTVTVLHHLQLDEVTLVSIVIRSRPAS